MKKSLAGLTIVFLLAAILEFELIAQPVKAGTITVPDDYSTIQLAINHANDGDSILVRSGTYSERVIINKTIALVGENRDTTVIDGSYVGVVVNVTRDGVSFTGFTVRRSGIIWNIGGPPYGAGMYLKNVTDCDISWNKFIQDAVAIQLEYGADRNIIVNNTMTSVGLGLGTLDASWNTFTGNNVRSNDRGLGINVNSDYNTISGNIITASEWVIAMHACHYNNITENYVANGQIGIYLPDSSNNRVYNNQIVNNALQASLQGFPSHTNYWDNGYPSGGNYWGDYAGVDEKRGVDQTISGSDGIGDTPYVIDVMNQDRYPLMKPWAPAVHDAGVVSIMPSADEVYVGQVVNVTSVVRNEGSATETLTVACRYELEGVEHLIAAQTVVNLAPGANATLTFTWATADVTMHTIKVEILPLAGETHTADNTMICSTTVRVKMVGDVNGDNKVDLRDIATAALTFGSYIGHPRWNPQADINRDGNIDIRDLVLIAKNYGKTYP